MKRTIYALLATITATMTVMLALAGCATASAEQEAQADEAHEFHYVHDWSEPKEPNGMVRIMKEKQEREAKAAQEAAEAEAAAQAAWEAEQVYYEDYSASYAPRDNGDGFAFEGVRDYNGTTETWYSSNQAYHHRTGEWTADDEGYYRDSEGYYVVASEDHAEGEVFDTSKGKAKVYDGGCDSGVTDFYVNFG